MNIFKKPLRIVLLAMGVLLFFWAIHSAGFSNLKILTPVLTGWGVLCLFLFPFVNIWDAIGWYIAFPKSLRASIKPVKLFNVRIVGEALNGLTPFVDVGGEYFKVRLVSKLFFIEKKIALVSVIVARTALFLSETGFWVLGVALLFIEPHTPLAWRWISVGVVVSVAILGFGLVRLQQSGFLGKAAGWLERIGLAGLLEKAHIRLDEIDKELASFYRSKDRRFAIIIVFHFLGWIAGGVEMWVMLRLLGVEATLFQGIAFEALLQLLKTASFLIPGNFGAQEAGLSIIGQWMGWHPAVGVAASLLKRLRQFVWTGIGLALWAIYEWSES